MPVVAIGLFYRIADAEAARRALLAAGVDERRITLQPGGRQAAHAAGDPLPSDAGLAGFVGRMFSGALMDHAAVDRYLFAARDAQAVLAVHEVRDDEAAAIRATLASHGAFGVEGVDRAAAPTASRGSMRDVEAEVAAPTAPAASALPNAPTDWEDARPDAPPMIGSNAHDPARPEGDLHDASGLGPDADRSRIGRAKR